MITRSYDPELMKEALSRAPSDMNQGINYEDWLAHPNNIMLVEGEDIGLVVHNYPGVCTGHWFYKSRGRDALRCGERMIDHLFDKYGMKAIRGITRVDLKAARWAARQVGFTSYGILEMDDGEYELFCLTKDEFYKHLNKGENN